jgi:hypothetical protein
MKHPERTFISKKILWDTKEFNFSSWIWTHTVSATQGCAAKWIQGYNICSKFSEFQIEKEKSHTHTHTQTHTLGHTQTKCWYTLPQPVIKFLHSIYWITTFKRWDDTEQQDSRVHSITSHNANERFSFKDSYAYPKSGYTQWVWNSGYSKNFYKEQTN